jgi:hypothetical protein
MATFDYAGLRDGVANRLLERFGQAMTLTKTSPLGDYDTETGRVDSLTQTYEVVGVVLDKDKYNYTKQGSLVIEGERNVILSAKELTVAPELSDKLSVGAVEYRIVRVRNTLSPGGVTVLYDLVIKGA